MFETLLALLVALAELPFDYHVRTLAGDDGRMLIIWCNEGQEKPFEHLYGLIGPNLKAYYWKDTGRLPKIYVPYDQSK